MISKADKESIISIEIENIEKALMELNRIEDLSKASPLEAMRAGKAWLTADALPLMKWLLG